jgi:hypothetical protein
VNDEDDTVEPEPCQDSQSAAPVAPVSDTDAKGMLVTKEGTLITCRDGQNRFLMLSICAAFRSD